MTGQVEVRWRPRLTSLLGERVVVQEVEVPEDAPVELKEGLARRQVVDAGGTCPCGARLRLPSRAVRRRAQRTNSELVVTVHHAPGCPARLDQWIVEQVSA